MYVSPHIYNMYEASPPSRPYCVSTIFHSSLFPKRKCNSHSSFFILHSSFKKSPSVGRVTARYSPRFLLFPLTHINETANNVYFSKKYPQKFW